MNQNAFNRTVVINDIKNQCIAAAIEYKAYQADQITKTAWDKMVTASDMERSYLIEQANIRSRERETAWDKTIEAYRDGLSKVPGTRSELKVWWADQIKAAKNAQKKKPSITIKIL